MIGRVNLWSVPSLFSTLNLFVVGFCASRPATRSRFIMEHSSDIHLRIKDDSDQFQLGFLYRSANARVNKQLHFTRNLSEPVGAFLSRLSMKVNDAVIKKQKKNRKTDTVDETTSNTPVESDVVGLIKNGVVVPDDVLCKDVFTCDNDSSVILQIGDQRYNIFINYPWIQTITLPKSIMVGYPVFPNKFISYYTDEAESQFDWHRVIREGHEFISSGFVYVPNVRDIGHKLKLVCTPKRNVKAGFPVEITSSTAVEAGPGFCPFETRHAFTRTSLTGDS